jgi:hypothetical protein
MSSTRGGRVKRKAKVLETKPGRPWWGYCDIAVVTHESMEMTFYSCVCDDVLEHASNYRKVTVQMYVCVPGAAWCDEDKKYHNGLQVAGRDTFKKILVEETRELKDIECGLMLILAHGDVAVGETKCTPHIAFIDDTKDLKNQSASSDLNLVLVHAAPVPADEKTGTPGVTMLQVTHQAGLCGLMCCYAGEIVRDHLKAQETTEYFEARKLSQDAASATQEYFYFEPPGGIVRGYSMEILISWIIDLVDYSEYYHHDMHMLWRNAIVHIMQTVKLFGNDYSGFFHFLCAIGLIEQDHAVRTRMQMASVETGSQFVVRGHKFLWSKALIRPSLLSQFKALCLTTYVPGDVPTHLTPENSADLLISPDAGVDMFLKRYIRKQASANIFGDDSSSRSSSSNGAGSATELRSDESDGEHNTRALRACLGALQAMDA